ncbi:unnamed protein product [Callosobruchus maculatus]|nr:unnamed protein product [Callosobruchus maculatus]
MGPWCYTMNYDLEYETCGIPLCSYSLCKITGPGMEYAGKHGKTVSDRNCLKWNKDRKKVRQNDKHIEIPKYDKQLFPENNLADAKKYCRNPDGDIGGPWCFVENEASDDVEKEYCDIPLCDDPTCMVFTKNYDTYTHFTDFNDTLDSVTFGVKLWDSDSFLDASARLLLSVMALPLTGKEMEQAGAGIEILIGNNFSALRFGNNDQPEYEPTPGILKSTKFTMFTLNWHAGFITLNVEGRKKSIFLAEYKTKGNLLGHKMNEFLFYAAQGTNVLWHFPFCFDDFECDVHTTTASYFQQFWPLREKDIGRDLYVHVRAFHSARILFVPSPTVAYPWVKIVFSDKRSVTKITTKEYEGAHEVVLKEIHLTGVLSYWSWNEFSISMFANTMNMYVEKALGLQIMADLKHEVFRKMRWFSVSSMNTVAHWSFYCSPPHHALPPPAVLPECSLNAYGTDYKGTQDVTNEGLPCLPWSGVDLIRKVVDPKAGSFKNETPLTAWNYCRNPAESAEGVYCYTIALDPQKAINRTACHLRRCKSADCHMAGTGNDYIGNVAVTRSNRTCDTWDFTGKTPNDMYKRVWNGTLFAEQSQTAAKNYCRNPNRNISGSWCFTTDTGAIEDSCNVRDCDKSEECTVVVDSPASRRGGRAVFILPQWKESGHHGGLRFSVKEWNPDMLDGLEFAILPRSGDRYVTLQIGAEYNEKLRLIRNDAVIIQKTMPHLILAGKEMP